MLCCTCILNIAHIIAAGQFGQYLNYIKNYYFLHRSLCSCIAVYLCLGLLGSLIVRLVVEVGDTDIKYSYCVYA